MKHGARNVSAFLMSTVGSGVLAGIVFLLFNGPCPEIVSGVRVENCVGSMYPSDFAQVASIVCLGLGIVAAGISELLPGED